MATYYVSTLGNNAANGLTEGTPWATLAYAEANATTAGDIIALKKGDTFVLTVHLNIDKGGTIDQPIIWDGSLWGIGANAIVTTNGNTAALFRIVNCQNVIIQNITFDGNKTNTHGVIVGLASTMFGMPQQNNEQYITIQDCTIKNIGNAEENWHAVLVETVVNDISNITIQRNTIDYVAGAGIFLYCGRSLMGAIPSEERDCYIGYNTINDYSTAGTAEAIGINNRVTNCIFEYNTITAGINTVVGLGIGIGAGEYDFGAGQAGYFPTDIIIRYNDVRMADYPAVYIQGCQAQSLTFYCNKFYRATATEKNGVIRIEKDYADLTYAGADLKFYNNTIVSESGGSSCFSDLTAYNGVVTFKNNLMINTASSGSFGLFYVNIAGSTIHDYNAYYRSAAGDLIYYFSGTPYIQYHRADVASIETNIVSTDPLLTNLAGFDWTLQSGSPAIGAGINVGLTTDYAGNAYAATPSIGAYEYVPTMYYIKNGGDDTKSGKDDVNAWATIAKVNATTFNPGDEIRFNKGDTWRETLTVPSSGTLNNYITFSSYGTGNKPKILGSTQAINWTNISDNIWTSSTSVTDPNSGSYKGQIYFIELDGSIKWGHVKKSLPTSNLISEYDWTWDANQVYIYSTTDPDARYSAVEVSQNDIGISLNNKEYITLSGLDIKYWHLAGVKGLYPAVNVHGLDINNCDIGFISTKGSLAGFGLSIYHSDCIIHHNTIHDCGRRGISIALDGGTSTTENVTIEDNYFHTGFHTTGPDMEVSGDHSINNVIIRRNLFYDDPTLVIDNVEVYQSGGLFVQEYPGAGSISNVFVYDNIFQTTIGNGAAIDKTTGPIYILNNTFYGLNPTLTFNANVYIVGVAGAIDVNIKNNIFYGNIDHNITTYLFCVFISTAAGTTVASLDYNLYYQTDSLSPILGIAGGKRMTDWETYKATSGYDAHSLDPADPSFVSSSDYHLQAGSPAIGAGINVGLTTDYAGNLWNATPSIGAYEYGSSLTLTEGTWLANRTTLNAMYDHLYQLAGL